MSTITIDNSLYEGAEQYARQHNTSIRDIVESSLKALISTTLKQSAQAKASDKWNDYVLSPEIAQMTLKDRENVSDNLEETLYKSISEKYK